MIETIPGFPDRVVALSATGLVTKEDYERTLIPAVEAESKRFGKIRLYYELGPRFSGMAPGAMWDDMKVGIEHLTQWERCAIVTNVDWIHHLVNVFKVVMPGHVRIFPNAKAAEARAWILA